MTLMRLLLLASLLLGACTLTHAPAKQPHSEALTSLKVDISQVADADAVEPVNGITSSGQPDDAALRVFSDSGYVAVIDLRGKTENRGLDEKAAVEELGMRYLSFPIAGRDDITFDAA